MKTYEYFISSWSGGFWRKCDNKWSLRFKDNTWSTPRCEGYTQNLQKLTRLTDEEAMIELL